MAFAGEPFGEFVLGIGAGRSLMGGAMRLIRSLLIYFAVVFLGGALLAPWLYWLVHWAASQWPSLAHLAASPFHRYVARALLGLALIGLVPLLRNAGMFQGRAVGFGAQGRPAMDIGRGFCIGFASLACVAVLALAAHASTLTPDLTTARIIHGLLGAALTAAIVAVLEELLFRGALFGVLRKTMPWPGALVVSSAVYSAAHFIQSAKQTDDVHWYSGFVLLVEMFRHGPPFIPAFFTLFVAGSCLALAYQRTGALYFSIGLHAGWIFWLSFYKLLTRPARAVHPTFWGTDKLIDGWLAFALLVVVFVVILTRVNQPVER